MSEQKNVEPAAHHGHQIATAEEMEDAAKRYPGPSELVHLHVHTIHSTLDGVATPSDYVGRAKEFGMQAISCTDHGSLGAIPDMYFECQKNGVKFIPGIEAYLNEFHPFWAQARSQGIKIGDIRADNPEVADRIMRNRHLIILSKNSQGFQNLLNVTSDAWDKGFYFRPRLWMDSLRERKEGLIVLSGCINGPISYELMKAVESRQAGDAAKAEYYLGNAIEWVKRLKDEFAEDFFLELQMPGPDIKEGYEVLQLGIMLAKQFNVRTALTGDSHYLHREDWNTQRALMAVGQKMTIDDPNLFIADTCEGFLKSRAEFRQTFWEQNYHKYATIEDIEAACDGTLEIAERCETFTPDLSPKLPEIEDADQKITEAVASALIQRGLHASTKKYPVDGREVTHVEQAEIELERIREKGFSSYFLICKDLVDFSRSQGWPVAPGRGSAPGSLVCFLLGITELDPLKWGLSFNRFLSPSRGGYMLKITMD